MKETITKRDLPPHLYLLGEVYSIEDKDLSETDFVAQIDYRNREIQFDLEQFNKSDYAKEELKESFWHELCHYFCRYYGLNNNEFIAEALAKFIISINEQVETYTKVSKAFDILNKEELMMEEKKVVNCDTCNKKIIDDEFILTLKCGKVTYHFCGIKCLTKKVIKLFLMS